jgi:hypothetical protein
MKRLALSAVASLTLGIAACGISGQSANSHVAGCKAAMLVLAKKVASGSAASGPPAKEPAACKGLPAAELRRLFRELMREAFNGG